VPLTVSRRKSLKAVAAPRPPLPTSSTPPLNELLAVRCILLRRPCLLLAESSRASPSARLTGALAGAIAAAPAAGGMKPCVASAESSRVASSTRMMGPIWITSCERVVGSILIQPSTGMTGVIAARGLKPENEHLQI
jgi:hypothetical protein